MSNHSRKTMALAVLTAAALTVGSIPSYAHSASYCRDYARQAASSSPPPALIILPLAALGAGAGALVGVAAPGLWVSTGALVGAGTGTAVGATGATVRYQNEYNIAYAECRSGSR